MLENLYNNIPGYTPKFKTLRRPAMVSGKSQPPLSHFARFSPRE